MSDSPADMNRLFSMLTPTRSAERPSSFKYASIASCRFGASKVSNCSVVTGSWDGSAPRCWVIRSRSGLSVLAAAAICVTNSANTDARRAGGRPSAMPPIIGRSRLRPLRSSPSSRGPRYSRSMGGLAVRSEWPELHLASWQTTCDTLHMWTQIVGKVRLALEPMVNHWWQVPFYVSGRGLTTSLMHADGKGLEMEFDFVDHVLFIRTTLGESRQIVLKPQAVADFYAATLIALREDGVRVSILARPAAGSDAIPFAEDRVHSDYDADAAGRFLQAPGPAGGGVEQVCAGVFGAGRPGGVFLRGVDP